MYMYRAFDHKPSHQPANGDQIGATEHTAGVGSGALRLEWLV